MNIARGRKDERERQETCHRYEILSIMGYLPLGHKILSTASTSFRQLGHTRHLAGRTRPLCVFFFSSTFGDIVISDNKEPFRKNLYICPANGQVNFFTAPNGNFFTFFLFAGLGKRTS